MPFTPFTKKSAAADPNAPPSAPPAFAKKSAGKGRSRKTGKVAPAQKALMSGGRSLSSGGRR